MFHAQGQDLLACLWAWGSCEDHFRWLAWRRGCPSGSGATGILPAPWLPGREKAAATCSAACAPVDWSFRRTRDSEKNLSLLNQYLFLKRENKHLRDLQKKPCMKQQNLNVMVFQGSACDLHLSVCILQILGPKECLPWPRSKWDHRPSLTSQPSPHLGQVSF